MKVTVQENVLRTRERSLINEKNQFSGLKMLPMPASTLNNSIGKQEDLQESYFSLLDIQKDEPGFWMRRMDELLETDASFKFTGLFTKNHTSITKMRFFAITEGLSLIYKKVA
jgi:hypothetical protein